MDSSQKIHAMDQLYTELYMHCCDISCLFWLLFACLSMQTWKAFGMLGFFFSAEEEGTWNHSFRNVGYPLYDVAEGKQELWR